MSWATLGDWFLRSPAIVLVKGKNFHSLLTTSFIATILLKAIKKWMLIRVIAEKMRA